MQSTISTLAAQLVAERAALEAGTHTDEEAAPILDALTEREVEILRMPSQSARDLAVKIHISGREYLESEGTLTSEIVREVDTLIAAGCDASQIDSPQDREQRANPRPIIPKQPDPLEPIVAEVDGCAALLSEYQILSAVSRWWLHRKGGFSESIDLASQSIEEIKQLADSKARRIALYLIEHATEGRA